MGLFFDEYGMKEWAAGVSGLLIIAAITGLVGGAIYEFAPNHGDCQAGTHSVITAWIPVSTGKTVIMVPITECEAN